MRHVSQAVRAEQARAGFFLACARLLQTNGFLAMDLDGQAWAHGLHIYPTMGDALLAANEEALSRAWAHLTEQPS